MDHTELLKYNIHKKYSIHDIVVFLERDGTIIKEKGNINNPDNLELESTATQAIGSLNKLGIPIIVFSNQPRIQRGIISYENIIQTHDKLKELLEESGVFLDGIYFCPHFSANQQEFNCKCNITQIGVFKKALKELNLKPRKIYVIGGRTSDIALSKSLGGVGVLIKTGFVQGEWEYSQDNFFVKPAYIAENIEDAVRWILFSEFEVHNDIRLLPTPHYKWPEIDGKIEHRVVKQLYSTISIADKSGIISEFEQEWCNYTDRKYAVSFNSGTMAIYAAFRSIGILKGSEVILPAYGFFATASPLLTIGAIPVFVDVDHTGNIDPQMIEAKLSKKTCAIVVSHIYGIPANMSRIIEIANKYHLPIIEDASHAFGARQGELMVGKCCTISVFSLQSNKLTPAGEGGILLTDDYDLYIRATLQGNFNKRNASILPKNNKLYKFHETGLGLKLKIHPLAAAIGIESLRSVNEIRRLREICYNEMTEILKNTNGISIAIPDYNASLSFYTLPLILSQELINKKNMIINDLRAAGYMSIFDHPSSGVIPLLALFKNPYILIPDYLKIQISNKKTNFIKACNFNDSIVLLPLWHRTQELSVARNYAFALKHKIMEQYSLIDL